MESGRLHDLLESTKLEMTAVKSELTSAAQQIERLEETDSERRVTYRRNNNNNIMVHQQKYKSTHIIHNNNISNSKSY